jgi:hypothetical protein
MAFRTAVLSEMGGFDPALGAGTPAMGGDDLAAFFSVITRGYRLVYQPAAILYHQHRPDYPDLRRQAYGYGVGLAAFLVKAFLERPQRLLQLALRLPAGLAYLISPASPKNRHKSDTYPSELTRLELKGSFMALGILACEGWSRLCQSSQCPVNPSYLLIPLLPIKDAL